MTTPKFEFVHQTNATGHILYAGLDINVYSWRGGYNNHSRMPISEAANLIKSIIDGKCTDTEVTFNSTDGDCRIKLKDDKFEVALGCAMDVLGCATLTCSYSDNKDEINKFLKYIYDGFTTTDSESEEDTEDE
jgi:hypothetical protein